MTARLSLLRASAIVFATATSLLVGGVSCTPAVAPPPVAKATPALPPAIPPAPRDVRALSFLGDEAIVGAAWTSSGDLVAHSRRSFFHTSFAGGAPLTRVVRFEKGITALTVAKAADVLVVISGDDQATVFEKGERRRSFAAPGAEHDVELSTDGRRLAFSSGGEVHVHDVVTGSPLGVARGGSARLDPSGNYVATLEGVFTVEGRSVYEPPSDVNGVPPDIRWVGKRAVAFTRGAVEVIDPEKGLAVPIPLICSEREEDAVSTEVDPIRHRAVRVCGDKLLYVETEPLRKVEVTLPKSKRKLGYRTVWLTADGTWVLRWMDMESDAVAAVAVVDVAARAARLVTGADVPVVRYAETQADADVSAEPIKCRVGGGEATEDVCRAEFTAARDRAFLHESGVLQVLAGGKSGPATPLLEWGERYHKATTRLVVEGRAGGLDVLRGAVTMKPPTLLYRVGPVAPPVPSAPTPPDKTCATGRERYARVGDKDVYIDSYRRRVCVCDGTTCATPTPSDPSLSVVAASEHGMLAATNMKKPAPKKGTAGSPPETQLELFGGARSTTVTVLGRCGRPAIASDRVLMLCMTTETFGKGSEQKGDWVELSLPDLKETRRVRFEPPPHRRAGISSPMLYSPVFPVGQVNALIETQSAQVSGYLYARDGAPIAHLVASSTMAAALFDDGRVELFGESREVAPSFMACVEEGVLKPFASCRNVVETKGALRFDVGLAPKGP